MTLLIEKSKNLKAKFRLGKDEERKRKPYKV